VDADQHSQYPKEGDILLSAAVQRIDLVAHLQDALLHRVMVDQVIDLQLSGFAPAAPVTIQAVYTPSDGVWTAQATFLTDDNGCVDVATQVPLSGSYCSVDPMGLFWSMERDASAQSPQDDQIKLTAMQGSHTYAAATVERLFVAPGVTSRVVCEQGLYATLFTPPGDGPHPGLLDYLHFRRRCLHRTAMQRSR
jgi:hypothetical protein